MSAESTLDVIGPEQPGLEEDLVYRRLARGAVLSVVFAFLSLAALLFPALLFLPALGTIFGLWALWSISRFPQELSGKLLAWTGTIGCTLVLVGGAGWHRYRYVTEVPPGYERISFNDLQPDAGRPGEPPRRALELDGKRVFIKGYVHPGVSGLGEVRHFVLVPDMGTCCFGGQPKLTDMVEVTIVRGPGIQYARQKRKLAGVFRVNTRMRKTVGELQAGYYELQAEYVD